MRSYVLLALVSVVCLCSCATLRGTKQRLKVASSPAGAEIYDNGQFLGTTPAFIEIKRAKNNSVLLKRPGSGERKLLLKGKYRWGESFAVNFVWLSPLFIGSGIGIDFWTGAAWDFDSPPIIKWNPNDAIEPTLMRRIVVAPPQAENEVLSDELALIIQEQVKAKYPRAVVLEYETQLPLFARFSYTNESGTPEEYQDDLHYSLGVTHLIESKSEVKNNRVILKSKVKDVFTQQTIEEIESSVEINKVRALNRGFLGKQLTSLASLVPNTLAFNIAGYFVSIQETATDLTQQYRSRFEREPSALGFLTGLSLRNVKSSEVARRWRLTWRYVPSIVLSYNRLRFDRDVGNELIGTSFRWYTGSLGIGPEAALEMPVGLIYMNLIPALGASLVNWSKDGDKSDLRGNLVIEAELGYLVFLSQNINLRAYFNFLGTDKDQWSSVLNTATGRDIRVDTAGFGSIGISLGYFFPEFRSTARNIIR